MADADFWRDLAARFRALPNDHGLFCVDWKQLASGVRIWIPRGTRSTMSQFDAVAARAGVAIDPTGPDPRETWLEALIGTFPTANLTSATTQDEPPSEGKIKDPCGASADLCSALESRTVQSSTHVSETNPLSPSAPESVSDTNQVTNRALSLLEAHPDFPSANVQMYEWQKVNQLAEKLGSTAPASDERLDVVLKAFDARAEACLRLVDNIELQKAFVAALNKMARTAWHELTGQPFDPELLSVFGEPGQKRWGAIIERVRHWDNEGFRRLADTKPPRTNFVQRAAEQIESAFRRRGTLASPASPSAPQETIGTQIRRLRDECRWTIEELASVTHTDERTIRRHETDEVTPYARTIRTYERVFSKQLNRKIVITKMP